MRIEELAYEPRFIVYATEYGPSGTYTDEFGSISKNRLTAVVENVGAELLDMTVEATTLLEMIYFDRQTDQREIIQGYINLERISWHYASSFSFENLYLSPSNTEPKSYRANHWIVGFDIASKYLF